MRYYFTIGAAGLSDRAGFVKIIGNLYPIISHFSEAHIL